MAERRDERKTPKCCPCAYATWQLQSCLVGMKVPRRNGSSTLPPRSVRNNRRMSPPFHAQRSRRRERASRLDAVESKLLLVFRENIRSLTSSGLRIPVALPYGCVIVKFIFLYS